MYVLDEMNHVFTIYVSGQKLHLSRNVSEFWL